MIDSGCSILSIDYNKNQLDWPNQAGFSLTESDAGDKPIRKTTVDS